MRPILLLALCLAGCAANPPVSTTSVTMVAKKTALAADELYVTASVAGGNLVVVGALDINTYLKLDNEAFAELQKVKAGEATIAELAPFADALRTGGR